MADPTLWGRLIQELREEQNVTQRALSERAGVNRVTLRKVEKGLTVGDVRMIEAMLNVLGYDLEAIERTPRQQQLWMAMLAEQDPVKRSALAAQRLAVMTTMASVPRSKLARAAVG